MGKSNDPKDHKNPMKIINHWKKMKDVPSTSLPHDIQAAEKMAMELFTKVRNTLPQPNGQGTEDLRNPNNFELTTEDMDVIMTDIEDKCIIKIENAIPAHLTNQDTYPNPYLCLSIEDFEERTTGKTIVKVNGHVCIGSDIHCHHLGYIDIDDSISVECTTQKLENLCDQWEIEQKKVTAVVTKVNSLLNAPIRAFFGNEKLLYSFLERVNIVGLDILERENVKDAILNIKLMLSFSRNDGENNSDVHSDKDASQANSKCIYNKWFSDYEIFKNFLEFLQGERSNFHPLVLLTELEKPFIIDMGKILQPLNMLISELAKDKKKYISEIIPMMWLFRKNFSAYEPISYRGRLFKNDIEELLDSRFNDIEYVNFFAISTLLDPRFKRFYFDDQKACKISEECINKILKHGARVSRMKNVATGDSIWDIHDAIYFSNAGMGMHSELNHFLEDAVLPRIGTNPVQYWHHNASRLPNLSKIAIEFLCIPM